MKLREIILIVVQEVVDLPFSISPPSCLISTLIFTTAPGGLGVWESQGAIFRRDALVEGGGVDSS